MNKSTKATKNSSMSLVNELIQAGSFKPRQVRSINSTEWAKNPEVNVKWISKLVSSLRGRGFRVTIWNTGIQVDSKLMTIEEFKAFFDKASSVTLREMQLSLDDPTIERVADGYLVKGHVLTFDEVLDCMEEHRKAVHAELGPIVREIIAKDRAERKRLRKLYGLEEE